MEMATPVDSVPAHGWGIAPNGEFWNGNAKRFIFAPAFDFADVPGATRYAYEVFDDFHCAHSFEAPSPRATLDAAWNDLPTGYVTVVCRALDASGAVLGEAGHRTFWKKSAFAAGKYQPAAKSYADAWSQGMACYFNLPQTTYLAEHGRPDPSYYLSGYPSKMLSAQIETLVACASSADEAQRSRYLDIARKAADYLIAEAVPAGCPLEFFTRTYDCDGCEYDRFRGEPDRIMLIYPAEAGLAFLHLYGVTGETKYLAAAERIAATFMKLQGDDGTWFLILNAVTGREYSPNRLIPTRPIDFLEDMFAATGRAEYRAAADRAFAYIEKIPMRDWNWEGQFEDIRPPAERWMNLSKDPACEVAQYMLRRFPGDPARLRQAEELVRFSEDQFVEWTPPYDNGRFSGDDAEDDGTWARFCRPYSRYMTPCALEQYMCYVPIDASAAKFIDSYLALWRATGNDEYLAKARALGDTATRVQAADGFLITWWVRDASRHDDRYHTWVNCMLAILRSLSRLAELAPSTTR